MDWRDWRALQVAQRVEECPGVVSLRLVDPAGAALPRYAAGQYLTFRLRPPGAKEPLVRCYSLSSAPGGAGYWITVKRVDPPPGSGAPPGVASRYLTERVRKGDRLEVRPPQGTFTAPPGPAPLVLIAGGIGITPLRSILEDQTRRPLERDVFLFYGVRHGGDHPFADELKALAARERRLRLVTVYSRPRPADRARRAFDVEGRVDIGLIKSKLPRADEPYRFFLCGPPAMLADLSRDLEALGVPKAHLFVEAFGAATVKPLTRRMSRRRLKGDASAPQVTFSRSGKTVAWTGEQDTLLDFAMANDVWLSFACAAGHCGTCLTKLTSGQVEYGVEPQFPLREGQCLPCIGTPAGDVELDC